MAPGKCKSGDDNNRLLSDCKNSAQVALDGIMVVHRYNPNIVAECMAMSVNNCIWAPFVTGCRLRMSCSDGSWLNYDQVNDITNLPEINTATSFLTKNNFIAGPNNPAGTNMIWVTYHLIISVNSETINNDNMAMERNNAILGTSPANQENHNIFNGTEGELEDFVSLKSPWNSCNCY